MRGLKFPCRGTRHWMQHEPPLAGWQPPDSDYWRGAWTIVHLECQRPGCGVWRHIAIDHIGNVLADKYDGYPDGYRMDRDQVPSPGDVRLWMAESTTRKGARRKRTT